MPGSNQPTKVSANLKSVVNSRVIEFETPPRYRNREVDITDSNLLLLHDILILSGRNQGGKRAKVDNLTQVKSGFCKVIIDDSLYKIHVSYTGKVSSGIEEV